jgi:NAD(P)-dependent dehydrogenase (short-subunit alcohol dehydrogenase family)
MTFTDTLFNVKDKVAVVTGGSGILGGEMARGLLQAGAKVILLARTESKLDRKVDELREIGGEVSALACDVLDETGIRNVNQKILQQHQHIDILINAAGGHVPDAIIGVDESIFDLRIESFRRVTDLNLNGTVLPTLIFGESMARQNNGSIINISSMATQRAISRAVGYSAAKAGVENFTRWLAVELAHKFGSGIRVNAIAPGFFLTEQNKDILTNKDGSLTDRGKTIINITPFKRFGEPQELIGTVLWLASDASRFVTGTITPVDGGFSVFSGV